MAKDENPENLQKNLRNALRAISGISGSGAARGRQTLENNAICCPEEFQSRAGTLSLLWRWLACTESGQPTCPNHCDGQQRHVIQMGSLFYTTGSSMPYTLAMYADSPRISIHGGSILLQHKYQLHSRNVSSCSFRSILSTSGSSPTHRSTFTGTLVNWGGTFAETLVNVRRFSWIWRSGFEVRKVRQTSPKFAWRRVHPSGKPWNLPEYHHHGLLEL